MLYQNQSDETLVMLTLAGVQSAYEVLVIRHQKSVISAAASVTYSRFMAEDVAQDAFVTAWMKLNTLQEPQKFGVWVCRIAKNCARNTVMRFRSFLPLDVVDNLNIFDDPKQNPAELYALSEEKEELQKSIGKLPDKVKQIIHLHYFEGLSIAEIADKMRISVGTVKWQLHDGRKRIRKELCAMNEKYSDTLVEKVMKKVEELKLWQVKNDKSGFEVVYNDVLREVEELPECGDKYHALADVLMRGWWWLPGEKNDALFARIREAAIQGKNDDVMEFIVAREDSQVYGGARIEFIRDKQIPMLEQAGFVQALGREWFWLGYQYFREGQAEKGREAYNKVLEILKPHHRYRALVPGALEMEKKLSADYKDKSEDQYRIGGNADEVRYIHGAWRYWANEGYSGGYLNSIDREVSQILRNSSRCDGYFFDGGLKIGESRTGSDGTTLTFVSDRETAETPCGTFHDCQLWVTKYWDEYSGKITGKSYYKSGIGIVRHEHTVDGLTEVRALKKYHIAGGEGLLPLASGNTWEYAGEENPEIIYSSLGFTVTHADDKAAIIASVDNIERLKYDENSWLDMIQEIRNEYCNHGEGGGYRLLDVSHAVERAEALAETPMQKAHTKAAASVVRRIMETEPTFNPEYKATGHWNFFAKKIARKKEDTVSTVRDFRWSFEWKNTGGAGGADTPLLYNDIYGILQDATKYLWSDEWRVGAAPLVEYMLWDTHPIKTQILCEDGGTVTTRAGTFANCLKLSLDIGGLKDGLSYRGGKKEYWFAPGVGIVRTVNEYCGGARKAVYELTSYKGVGEGYMPMADGLQRRYDALDLTDGFVGAAEYTYVADEEGDIAIFADRTGIREIPSPITQYASIQGEMLEEQLWDAGKWEETHLRHAANNFHLMLHFIARPSWNRNNADRSVELCKFNMHLMETFGGEDGVPSAWSGLYAWNALVRAAALFGKGANEEGYQSLDCAVAYCGKWMTYSNGDLLEVGNDTVFGGAKLIKEEETPLLLLPDGTREPVAYGYRLNVDAGNLTYALTAPHGWEWFNPVRNEDRFKEYVEQAKKLAETIK